MVSNQAHHPRQTTARDHFAKEIVVQRVIFVVAAPSSTVLATVPRAVKKMAQPFNFLEFNACSSYSGPETPRAHSQLK